MASASAQVSRGTSVFGPSKASQVLRRARVHLSSHLANPPLRSYIANPLSQLTDLKLMAWNDPPPPHLHGKAEAALENRGCAHRALMVRAAVAHGALIMRSWGAGRALMVR